MLRARNIKLTLAALALLLPSTLELVPASAQAAPSPNILLLISDDQAWSTMSRTLMPSVYSQLVDQGVLFNRAYVNSSLCCPSRSQVFTGLYEHHTGVDENAEQLLRPTLPMALHDQGYRTILAGKYLNSWGCDPRPEFDRWACVGSPPGNYSLTDPKINDDGVWAQHNGFQTDLLASRVTDFISSTPADQPFFAIYSPTTPHMPADDYRYNSMSIPALRGPSYDQETRTAETPMYLRRQPMSDTMKGDMDAQYRSMSRAVRSLDDSVSDILGSLGSRADDTLVIYVSDNGYMYGQHRRVKKTCLYEECVDVPMVIRYPAIRPTNQPLETEALAQNVDIAPTIAELTGIPWGADGVSLTPILNGSSPSVRDSVLIQRCEGATGFARPCSGMGFVSGQTSTPSAHGIVTDGAKYIRYVTGEAQLFDLSADPKELVNLAGTPGAAGLESSLSSQLDALIAPPTIETTIVTGPMGSLDTRAAEFTYFSQSRFATHTCRLTQDSVPGDWIPCNGGRIVQGAFEDGDYVFEVAGTDEFGSTDATPASRSFSVHASGPDVTISSGPSGPQVETSASFSFSSSVTDATFECRLGLLGTDTAWSACDPLAGASYSDLAQGDWLFEVRATDPFTFEVSAPPAARLFTVDKRGATVSLTARAATFTSSDSATFRFIPNERLMPGRPIKCKLDAEVAVVCNTGEFSAAGLSSKEHILVVTATDVIGTKGKTTFRWTVDTTAPVAGITGGPDAATTERVASFYLQSSEWLGGLQCAVDGGLPIPCQASTSTEPLPDGEHTFQVWAIDKALNVSAPAEFTWTIDRAKPSMTITSIITNGSTTESTDATFELSSDEPVTFQCSLDSAAFTPCDPLVEYFGLLEGTHTFQVFATDIVGNVSPTRSRTWTIVPPSPPGGFPSPGG